MPDLNPPAGLTNVIAIATSGSTSMALVSLPPTLRMTATPSDSSRLTLTLSGAPHVYVIESSAGLRTWQFLQHVTNHSGSVSVAVQNTSATTQFFRAKGL